MNTGEFYSVYIESTNIFGNGICHIDGCVVFVIGALDGDKCKIKITESAKKFAYAEIVEIESPSPSRIEPMCENYLKCGGCAFLHTDTEHENKIKAENIKGIFNKNKIKCTFDKIVAPVCENYRNKVVLFYENGGFGYKAPGSDKTVKHKKCLLNPPVFDKIADYVAKKAGSDALKALYIRRTSKGEILVCPVFEKYADISDFANGIIKDFPDVVSVYIAVNNEKNFALEKCKFIHIVGKNVLRESILGIECEVSPQSFFQVNHSCAEKMYDKVVEYVKKSGATTCADLFCGTGTIGLIVASRTGANVTGVEIEPDAVKNAKMNAKINNIKNIEFFEDDAKNFNKNVDLCIIDPPRKGCSDFMCKTLLRLSPKNIVYVSCNPSTLVRDLKILGEKYEICEPVSIFNMFPRTSHVECVVFMSQLEK